MFIYTSLFSFNSLVKLWVDKKPENFREKNPTNQIRGYLHIGISDIIKGKTISTGTLLAEIMQNMSEFYANFLTLYNLSQQCNLKIVYSFAIFVASDFFAGCWYIEETKRNKREKIISSMIIYYP